MKTISQVFYIIFFTTFIGLGQDIDTTEKDMAVVYFIEMTEKPLVVFSGVHIYDGHEPIGMVPLKYYLRYECSPGEHLFYSVRPENSYFVEANLLAGKIYIVEVLELPGVLLNQARIKPVNPTQKLFEIEDYRKVVNRKRSKSFYRNVEKLNKIFLKRAEKNKQDKFQRQHNKYDKKKVKEKVKVLYPHWHIESENLLLDSVKKGLEEAS